MRLKTVPDIIPSIELAAPSILAERSAESRGSGGGCFVVDGEVAGTGVAALPPVALPPFLVEPPFFPLPLPVEAGGGVAFRPPIVLDDGDFVDVVVVVVGFGIWRGLMVGGRPVRDEDIPAAPRDSIELDLTL